MTKVEILQKQLEEAEQAYHELMIGARTVSVNVEGVGSTSYAQADSSKLKEYISYLQAEIGKAKGLKNRKVIKVSF
nr:MAG TPA: Head to tail joining protein [Caudoviricetes sp.]